MDLRGTFNSTRFSEDDPPHIISKFQKKIYPQLKRKLFEADSDAEDLVQVCLRIKPSTEPNHLYEIRDDQSLITYGDTTTAGHGRRTQNNVSKMYKFSHIFGTDASQKEIFDLLVKKNLQKLADGQSYTLLTYGASGSGKTYTLMGIESEPGLVPRSLEYIFKIVDAAQYPVFKPLDGQSEKLRTDQQSNEIQWVTKLRQISAPVRDKYQRMSIRLSSDFTQSSLDLSNRTYYYVWVSFVEIYNEAIYDLLVPGDRRAMSKLIIREDSSGHVYVKGARQAFVRSGAEAYDVMAAGRHNLQVAATGVHANSSRSHCIFTITMLADTPEGVRTSCVRLCDLAGSERAKSTRNTGTRMAESRAINTSLHVLERCLHARRQQRPDTRVPYRESKLTRLLGVGLSGGEPVTMLVTVNPSPKYIHETRHVLQLAAVARDIQINNTVFESTSSTINSSEDLSTSNDDIMKLRAENERLHYELVQLMESHNELQNKIEEQRVEHSKNSKDMVQEVKNISKQIYEEHILSLTQQHKAEMGELLRELQQAKNSKFHCNMELLQQTIVQLENNIKKGNMNEIEKSVQQLRHIVKNNDKDDEDDEVHFVNVEEDNLSKSYVSEGKLDESRNYIRKTSSSILSSPLRISISSIDNNDSLYSDKRTSNTPENNLSRINESNENKIDESIENKLDESIDNGINESFKNKIDKSIDNVCDNNDESNNELLFYDDDESDTSTPEVIPVQQECEFKVETKSPSYNPEEINNYDTRQLITNNEKVSNDEPLLTTDSNKNNVSDSVINNKINLNTDVIVYEKLSKISEENDSYRKSKKVSNDANLTNLSCQDSKDGSLIIFENAEEAMNKEINKYNYDANVSYNMSTVRDSNFENGSLMSFENAEEEVNKEVALEQKNTPNRSSFFKFTKKDSLYFRNLNHNVSVKYEPITPKSNSRSPSINNVDTPIVYCNTVIKKKLTTKEHSTDVFDALLSPLIDTKVDTVEKDNKIEKQIVEVNKSIEKLTLVSDYKKNQKYFSLSDDSGVADNIMKENISQTDSDVSENKFIDNTATDQENTINQFDNIYKDVTPSNLTQFDLLLKSEDCSGEETYIILEPNNESEVTENKLKNKQAQIDDPTNETTKEPITNKTNNADEEKQSKRTKRALRPRRCKNIHDSDENENQIKNLQKEFSDVTLDKPVAEKIVPDIPSPEICLGDEENVPPPLDLMSCPSKSVLRSRRKLFTPRAEPLDQSPDSGGRPRVPRPSYCRAKRRLQ